MSAKSGTFDTKAEVLTLNQNIVVTSTSGYEGHLEEAVVDTRNGNMVSEKPMSLRMTNATIKANRFEVLQSGDLVRFTKGVVVNMTLKVPPASTPSPAVKP
jgi:lipopolysaccharide export system protein LptC